jgi:ribulose-phosphate 3-epimerase
MVKIAPSLLSANPACLGEEVQNLQEAQADLLHFDVMDGHFVPNMTYGPLVLKGLKKYSHLDFDVHLMVNNPEKFVPWYADAGADIITFHLEATKEPDALLKSIKKYGIKAGISLKPDTNIKLLAKLTEQPDWVLVMGVEPGFGGQTFREDTPKRIAKTREILTHTDLIIEVDGGINLQTAKLCVDAGADILVAGTAVFKNGEYKKNISILKGVK